MLRELGRRNKSFALRYQSFTRAGENGEYSKRMTLRRMVGSLLVVMLLLSITLPALCVECRAMTASSGCEEKHNSASYRHDEVAISMGSMSGDCDHCGQPAGVSAKTPRHEDAAELWRIAARGSAVCRDSAVVNNVVAVIHAPLLGGNNDGRGIARNLSVDDVGVVRSSMVRKFSAPMNVSFREFSYQPLSVSLKI
jgi:hypothetical protein